MLSVDIKEQDNIAIATSDGELSKTDIETLKDRIDTYINAEDKVPNVVLCVQHFPHWKTFDALVTHIEFVRNHHTLIQKVALVSDSHLLSQLYSFVDRVTGAKIRHFPESNLGKAIAWAKAKDDRPGEFEILAGFPSDVVAIEAKGIVTSQEYRTAIIPYIEQKLKEHNALKLLFITGDDFIEFSVGALWEDARFGLSHMTAFSKMAVVSDVEWIRQGIKLFSPLMPADIMVFDLVALDNAKKWIQY